MSATTPYRRKITLTVINTLPPNTTVWDTDLKGFCARRQRSSVITYLLKTRVLGRVRWFSIGRHGYAAANGQTWQPETARKQALQVLANPGVATVRPSSAVSAITFDAVADDFLAKHATAKKPRTQKDYANLTRLYLRPAFGSKPIRDITKIDVRAAHASWKAKRSGNYALAILSTLMNWAEDQGYRDEDTNPCVFRRSRTLNPIEAGQ